MAIINASGLLLVVPKIQSILNGLLIGLEGEITGSLGVYPNNLSSVKEYRWII